jgi:hypothetical protein
MRSTVANALVSRLGTALVDAVTHVVKIRFVERSEVASVLDETGLLSREYLLSRAVGQECRATESGECIEVVDVAAARDVVAAKVGPPLRVVA